MRYTIIAVLLLNVIIISVAQSEILQCDSYELVHVGTDEQDQADVFVYSLEKRQSINITNDTIREKFPTWSPDGQQIAFVADTDTNISELVLINADGTNRGVIHRQEFIDAVTWSPSGDYIAFAAVGLGEGRGLYIIDMTDFSVTRLDDGWTTESIRWSPDGDYLAVQGQDIDRIRAIYLIDTTTQEIQRLTPPTMSGLEPSWTPDNRLSYTDGTSHVMIDPFSSDLTPIEISSLSGIAPFLWSPIQGLNDAVTISKGDLWHFVDGNEVNLTDDTADMMWLDRSSDGEYVTYMNMDFDNGLAIYVRIINIYTGEMIDLPNNTDLPKWKPCPAKEND